MELFAALLLAVVESLLPKSTFHEGPPNYKCQIILTLSVPINITKYVLFFLTWKIKLQEKKWKLYMNNRVMSSQSEDISAGYHSGACFFELGFNVINYFKSSDRVIVWSCCFLANKVGCIIQKY